MFGFRLIRIFGSGVWILVCSQDRELLGEKKRNFFLCIVIFYFVELDRVFLRFLGYIVTMEEGVMWLRVLEIVLLGVGKKLRILRRVRRVIIYYIQDGR